MKILVVSDIHGNLAAIEEVLAREKDWDQCVSLGDVVDYGPWSNECVDLLESLPNCIKLIGNHEEYFIWRNYFNPASLSYVFYQFCLQSFDRVDVIKNYIPEVKIGMFTLQHTIGDQYIFADTNTVIDKNYFIGHSHRQFISKDNSFTLVNPGSVGQNRQYINRIDYAIWNTESNDVELKNIIYDVEIVINEMKKRNYPSKCIDYYNSKPKL